MRIPKINPSIARKLGYYVYLYVNPLDGSVFYVGKGKGGRALAHLRANEKRIVSEMIQEIRAVGQEPRIEILAHGLRSNNAALRVESAAIDLLGVSSLANAVRGHGTKYGRLPLEEVVALYDCTEANIREPAILFRITKLYRYGMTDVELYDATRSAWRLGVKRERAEYAFAVFEGIVREVYAIANWLPEGSTFCLRRGGRGIEASGRWEFVGTIAPDETRKRYVNRYVGHLYKQGAQNPFLYVNID